MPIKISPASDDALGIAFGKRKAQAIIRKQREDDEFKRTLHKVFYLPNGAKVTLNARGGTIHVQAVSSLISSSSPWFAYCATYDYLKPFHHAESIGVVHWPKHYMSIYPDLSYQYEEFAQLEMAASRAARNLAPIGRDAHIQALRADIANEFDAWWLLGSVFTTLPSPSTELLAPYFIQITNEDSYGAGDSSTFHSLDYRVFDGDVEVAAGQGTCTVAYEGDDGMSVSATNWPSCVPFPTAEYPDDTDRYRVCSTEVLDGYTISGYLEFRTRHSSIGDKYTQSLTFHRIDDAVTSWLTSPSTLIDQTQSWYGSTGDKAVQPGSIVHVFCLEYLVTDFNHSGNTYWTPSIDLIEYGDYIGYTFEPETFGPPHYPMFLSPEDRAILDSEVEPAPVTARAVRVLRHFAKKLTRKPGGLADREWVNATLSSGKSIIPTNTVLGSFDPITPWGLPEMIVLIENPNGSFRPAGNDYANAVNQTYVENTPHTGGWVAAGTTDEIRAMIMSEVLSRSGFA